MARFLQAIWRAARGIAARAVLTTIYSVALILVRIMAFGRRRTGRATGRVVVTGTFYNPGWFRSHIVPLTRSGVREVLVICDRPMSAVPGVRYCCPPRFLARAVSRAGAKFLWMLLVGARYRPDLVHGIPHLSQRTGGACGRSAVRSPGVLSAYRAVGADRGRRQW